MGLIRKFFWGAAFSATMMIISSQLNAPAQLLGKLGELREMKAKVDEYKRLQGNAPVFEGEPRTTLELEAQQNAAQKLADMIKNGETHADLTVSDSDMEYLIDGKKMVLIDGKYYEARADNIYMINGERVFYVNDKSRYRQRAGQKAPEGIVEVSSQSSQPAPSPGFTANPAQMMVELQKMQREQKARNEFLNQLMQEEPGAGVTLPPTKQQR